MNQPKSIDIGERMRQLMTQRKLVHQEIAEKMGVAKQTLSSMLSRPNVTTDNVQRFMTATGIACWEIFSHDPPSQGQVYAAYEKIIAAQEKLISLQERIAEYEKNSDTAESPS